nr:PAS domain S-box protein [Bacteroidota bacterium]
MKKILAIDDQSSNLELIRFSLGKYIPDYEVITALSGEEGIRLAREELPDGILLDIFMPEMNGFEVCKILKKDDSTRSIPILMVSALGTNSKIRIEGLNSGADAFISKPYDIAELVALVNVMLRIKNAEDLLRKRNENLEIFIKKQIKEFSDTEDRFLQISEYALEFFWEVDDMGLFTYVSPVIEKILGFKLDEIVGKMHIYDFCHPKNINKTKKLLSEIFDKRENYAGNEVLYLRKNGNKVWYAISGFPIWDSSSNFMGYRGVNHDITQRKLAEEARRKSLREIDAYQKKLKNLNSELTIAEEKERKKIAEYIHDSIGQTLSIANLKLSSLLNLDLMPKSQRIIQESSDLINNAIVESRTLTYDLSPPVLYEFGLIAAIKWKLDQISKKFGIKTRFQSSEESFEIDNDVRILLYRIICELLNNVIKHAEADLIKIELSRDQDKIFVCVIDNGKGFNFNSKARLTDHGGFGLFSINERLDSIQGSMVIESKPKKGMKARIIFPV